jgi:hypothetical protein
VKRDKTGIINVVERDVKETTTMITIILEMMVAIKVL